MHGIVSELQTSGSKVVMGILGKTFEEVDPYYVWQKFSAETPSSPAYASGYAATDPFNLCPANVVGWKAWSGFLAGWSVWATEAISPDGRFGVEPLTIGEDGKAIFRLQSRILAQDGSCKQVLELARSTYASELIAQVTNPSPAI